MKVKSFDEIMAEKRQRTLQNKGEEKQDTKAVTQLRNKKREATKPSTGTEKPKLCLLSHVDKGLFRSWKTWKVMEFNCWSRKVMENYSMCGK